MGTEAPTFWDPPHEDLVHTLEVVRRISEVTYRIKVGPRTVQGAT